MIHALTFALLLATSPEPPPPPVLREPLGAFFALSVADAPATARWYRDELGFKIVKDGEAPNKIAKFALLQYENNVIEIIEHSAAKPSAVKNAFEAHGIFKIGFVVRDLDAVYARVKERKIAIAYDLMNAKDIPLRSFSIRDHAGNMIQFFGK